MLSLLIIVAIGLVVASVINRQFACFITHGHTLYRRYERAEENDIINGKLVITGQIVRVYQHCLCGYETKGWRLTDDSSTVPQDQVSHGSGSWWKEILTRHRA